VRKVYTTHGNPFVTHHKASTDRFVPFGRSEGPDGYVTSPGSPFVDVWGEEGGVFVANDTDLGSIIYEFMEGQEEADKHISEVMGRSWKSIDDTLAVSWEVDAKTLYVAGTGYDVSSRIEGDIFACALQSESTAVVVQKLDDDDYAVVTLALSNGQNGSFVRSSFAFTITDPILFIGFGSTSDTFFTVTTPDTGSVVALWTYNPPVWTARTLYTCNPLQVDTTFEYSKALDNGYGTSPNEGNVMGDYSRIAIRGKNDQSDIVHLHGDRIVACSTDGETIGLLMQHYDGTHTRIVDHPQYSWSEYVYVQGRPYYSYPMMILIKWLYTWAIGYTACDTGKLLDDTLIESTSSFYTLKITPTQSGASVVRIDDSLPPGNYRAEDSSYTREAHGKMDLTGYMSLVVPPYDDIWAMRAVYTESGATHSRTWNSAIKLYAADPARDVYVYQNMTGHSSGKWIVYDTYAGKSPAAEDLEGLGWSFSGDIKTVIRANGADTVLHTRPNEAESGDIATRYDLNYEPLMPYYTQPQGPHRLPTYDHSGNWSNSESKTINKSINVAFKGRYIDSDSQKTLTSWSYKPDIENDVAATLNFRTFEDINWLKYKGTWTEAYRAEPWQLIAGWGRFTRRAGFKTVDADGAAFVMGQVLPDTFKTLPISLRMAT
jgi:hypothetical protein